MTSTSITITATSYQSITTAKSNQQLKGVDDDRRYNGVVLLGVAVEANLQRRVENRRSLVKVSLVQKSNHLRYKDHKRMR